LAMDGPRTPEGEVIMAHSMSSSLGCWPTHCPIHQSTAHPSSSPRLTWLGSCNHKCSNGSPSGRFFPRTSGLPRSRTLPEFLRLAVHADDCGSWRVERVASRAFKLTCSPWTCLSRFPFPARGSLNISNLTDSS